MSSIEQQLVDAAVTALNTNRPAGVPTIERATLEALEASDTLERMIVYPITDSSEAFGGPMGPLVRDQLVLAVEMRAAAAAGQPVDAAVDEMYVWAVKALAKNTFGGLAHTTTRGRSEISVVKADVPYCLRVTEFVIDYQVRANDAESRT